MGIVNTLGETAYYFVKLPAFSFRLATGRFDSLEDITRICPEGPKTKLNHDAVLDACEAHEFLKGQDPGRLADRYNAVSIVRESDVFLLPLLNGKRLAAWNMFYGLDILSRAYTGGPLLLLYSHTGSYYQASAAIGALGYRIFPFANWVDPAEIQRPFRWLYLLNMKLSERCYSGGRYLYLNAPDFLSSLRRILKDTQPAVVLSAIDLPGSFVTEKRRRVAFLGGKAEFPYRVIESFKRHGFPVIMGLPFLEFSEHRLRRAVRFVEIPQALSSEQILRFYASRLEEFIVGHPEQFLNLVNIRQFYV